MKRHSIVRKTFLVLSLFILVVMSAGQTPAAGKSDGWSFEIELYILATSIEGDASMGRITGVDIDVDFSDILDVLDIGAMIHFEAVRANKWGLVLDYGFMDVSG